MALATADLDSLRLNARIPFTLPDDSSVGLYDGGLYPDIEDPAFVSRLLAKTEFADTKSDNYDPNANPCASGPDFEVTPVQRFVANFLHPRTPYMSVLLYHGVGVGKTCAAIQAAEAYLDVFPRRKALIVCPVAIRPGFIRTIFDPERVKLGQGDAPNMASGCTGDMYLRLAGCLYERNMDLIVYRVQRVIRRRYDFFGYVQFSNYIRNVKAKVPIGAKDEKVQIVNALRKEFDYRMLIIDEAHNLRDVVGAAALQRDEEDVDTVGDSDEAKGAKELTPFLKELLQATEGMKLMLMTATPMFNSVFEIHFLINLMLMNDKKEQIPMQAILNLDGTPSDSAREVLRRYGNAYISFMRGENPNSFPLRLFPEGKDPKGTPVARLSRANYPDIQLSRQLNVPVSPEDKEYMSRLPIVLSTVPSPDADYNQIVEFLTAQKVGERGTGYQNIDALLQAGNCVFPVDADMDVERADTYVGVAGFDGMFEKEGKGRYLAKDDGTWLIEENLRAYSPKIATVLRYLKHAEGVGFVYSRFVTTGALLMALALEANGYTPYGREKGLFVNGVIEKGLGRQCALCSLRESEHSADVEHGAFVPAKYVLLTGDPVLSPNNAEMVTAARGMPNKNGGIVKVVLGSQIAGEGLDLRFIREVHILDAWFHLNKTEQIIGRGIRFCSHSALPSEKRNTTVFLHAIAFPGAESIETADLFCYRTALHKAIQVGVISRMLKEFAVDCNLRKNVVFLLNNMGYRRQYDSQRQPRLGPTGRGVPLQDMDYSAICDWMECPRDFTCAPDVTVRLDTSDDSTFDAFSARFSETKIKKYLQALFAKQPYLPFEALVGTLVQQGYAMSAVSIVLQGIINNRLFRISHGGQEGYLIYKNRYVLFQPDVYRDLKIPMALRIAPFPVKRDEYSPVEMEVVAPRVAEETKEGEETEEENGEILWYLIVQWLDDLIAGRQTGIPIRLVSEIERITGSYKAQREVYMHKLAVIVYMNKLIDDHKKEFEEAAKEYIWDEILTPKEQIALLISGESNVGVAGAEQYLVSGTERVIRYVDANTNVLTYVYPDGRSVPQGIVKAFEEDDKEQTMLRKADKASAGAIYGFVVPKMGKLVFKTNVPHAVGEKPEGGQECAIVTMKSHATDKLLLMGEALRAAGWVTDYEMDEGHLAGNLELKNRARGCIFLDIMLRYMDKLKIGGKRWFFRPVAAYWSGHRGRISAAAKSAAAAAEKAIKEAEAAPAVGKKVKIVRRVAPAAAPAAAPAVAPVEAPVVAPAAAPAVAPVETPVTASKKFTRRVKSSAATPVAPAPAESITPTPTPVPVPTPAQTMRKYTRRNRTKVATTMPTIDEGTEVETAPVQEAPAVEVQEAPAVEVQEAPAVEVQEAPVQEAPAQEAPAAPAAPVIRPTTATRAIAIQRRPVQSKIVRRNIQLADE